MAAEVPIARRNLLADKAKFFVALGGVTLAVVLILVVQSVYQGVRRDYASFIRSLPGEVWVAQKGISGLTFSSSFLTKQAATDVVSIPGGRTSPASGVASQRPRLRRWKKTEDDPVTCPSIP